MPVLKSLTTIQERQNLISEERGRERKENNKNPNHFNTVLYFSIIIMNPFLSNLV